MAATVVRGEPREQFSLTREGKPLATIVTAEEPTAVAAFAAAELQYHVQQITGAVLPIVTEGTKAMASQENALSRREFLENAGRVAAASALAGLVIPRWICSAAVSAEPSAPNHGFRGVFFNPNIQHAGMAGYPWPVFDPYGPEYRGKIRVALQELAREANVNLIGVFIPIPFTLSHPPQGPQAGQPLREWANLNYLNNVAVFVEDCHNAGISVEFDLVDNRWIPYRVDSRAPHWASGRLRMAGRRRHSLERIGHVVP